MKSLLKVLIFLTLLWESYCYLNFTGIEICFSYYNYSSLTGNYEQKGVPSPTVYPSARRNMLSTYDKNTNTFWIFGGEGYDANGGIHKHEILFSR